MDQRYRDAHCQRQYFLNQNFKDKKEIFHFLASHAVTQGWAKDVHKIEADLWERENQYSTGFENQIAIPHAKTANVSQVGAASN